MPEWLTTITQTETDPTLTVLTTRLLLAWLCGWLVAVLARRKKPAGSHDTLTLTLVLMSILIAMATQIIGDNIARAFSLVGALSIVRFRTAVPATRDVAFVLAAVVVGMAIGAGQYWVAGLGLVVVGLATQFNSPQLSEMELKAIVDPELNWRLTMQVGLSADAGWEAELQRLAERYELLSAETIRRGGAMELAFRLRPKPDTDAVSLLSALNATPNVESVTLKVV